MTDSGDVTFRPSGAVTFDNLMELRHAGEAAIARAADRVVFDLSDVDNGNSAAAALLMAWFRAAEHQDKEIVFVGVPDELRNIIELSGLSEALPLALDEPAASETRT